MPISLAIRLRSLARLLLVLAIPIEAIADSRQAAGDLGRTTEGSQGSLMNVTPALTIEAARERARLLHDVYATTLDVMHEHYFRRDGPVLPARAMEDVFSEMSRLSGIYANWISVNTQPMSIQHEPKTAFEKQAASELSAGKKEFEHVGKGIYRRAAPIPLRSSCVSCHTKMFSEAPKTPRFAGLVISIPLQSLEKK